MDLHCELVQDLQTLRRQYEEMAWRYNAARHVLACDQIRFGLTTVGPRALEGSGLAAVTAAIEQQTKTQRALKTMRVFHFQYMPVPTEARQNLSLDPAPEPLPENPDHRALLEAAGLADVPS